MDECPMLESIQYFIDWHLYSEEQAYFDARSLSKVAIMWIANEYTLLNFTNSQLVIKYTV